MAGSTYRTTAMAAAVVLGAALVIAAVILLLRGDGNSPIQVVIPTPETGLSGSKLPSAPEDTPASLPNPELKV